jgi:hypothetical protein
VAQNGAGYRGQMRCDGGHAGVRRHQLHQYVPAARAGEERDRESKIERHRVQLQAKRRFNEGRSLRNLNKTNQDGPKKWRQAILNCFHPSCIRATVNRICRSYFINIHSGTCTYTKFSTILRFRDSKWSCVQAQPHQGRPSLLMEIYCCFLFIET